MNFLCGGVQERDRLAENLDLELLGVILQNVTDRAVHRAGMQCSQSSSREKTMTGYGGCALIADACFA